MERGQSVQEKSVQENRTVPQAARGKGEATVRGEDGLSLTMATELALKPFL